MATPYCLLSFHSSPLLLVACCRGRLWGGHGRLWAVKRGRERSHLRRRDRVEIDGAEGVARHERRTLLHCSGESRSHAGPSEREQSEAARSNPKQPEAIRSSRKHPKQPEAVRSHLKQSEAARSSPKQPEAVRSHQKQSEAIRSNQKHSEAIREFEPSRPTRQLDEAGALRQVDLLDARLRAHLLGLAAGNDGERAALQSEAIRSNQKQLEAIISN